MRLVIQRVNHASVTVDQKITGSISKGLLVLIGFEKDDNSSMLPHYADKLVNLRIFADANDKTNLSLRDVNGSLLIVSQFTLYANCKKGNRPSFVDACAPDLANTLYEEFVELCLQRVDNVQTGIFGAQMRVDLENDGPFTVIFDSRDM